jgi:hypothetical protein
MVFILFLCQYHAVFIAIALQYSLKSGIVIPPALVFLLSIALAIHGLLGYYEEYHCKKYQLSPYFEFFGLYSEKWNR